MRHISPRLVFCVVLLAMLGMAGPPAYAQGGSTSGSVSGLVVDASGGVIPGVDVVVKNNATSAESRAVTDGGGRFTVPALPPGAYTVTVSLMGFKTVTMPDVQVLSATPASVKAVLEVGAVEETVVVTGATEIVQTQTASVSTTLAVTQIQQLPVITHTALDYVVSLPGVQTAGSNTRGSTINGLPAVSMNITLDGINVQDKRSNTEGFFMYIRPMMDSVEEITVSTSNPEAASTGAGAASIRMETRAGSNRLSGSVYNTWRNQAGTNDDDMMAREKHPGWLWRLNTPYWFNKRDVPKTAAGDYYINDVRLQTPGFRVGGPVLKDKLFYFFNYEEFRLPESRSRTYYLLNTNAQVGRFTYPAVNGSGNVTIDLLALAASKGQTATLDPTIAKLLGEIRQASGTTGGVSTLNVNVDQFNYVPTATQKRKFPTLRLDYNLTSAHRVTFSGRYNDFYSNPDFLNSADARWPGFPNQGAQTSGRYMWQVTERATIGKNLVNEARVGTQNSTGLGTYFGQGVTADQFNCSGVGCQQAGGLGWNFGFPVLGSSGTNPITSATAYNGQSASVASQLSIEDTVTWLKGSHTLSFGGSYAQIKSRGWNMTPTYATLSFGTGSVDTVAYNMLDATSGNYPGGISSTYAGYARNLYGFLTGRVTQIAGTYYYQPDGTYAWQGERTTGSVSKELGFFVSDSWRLKPNFTLNLGLRYQVALPMTTDQLYSKPETWQMVYGITGAGSGTYGQGNLYQGGRVATGTNPVLVPYDAGSPAYNTDWNNLSPSLGVAWRPNLTSSFLTKFLSADPVFRAGYSITYTRFGTSFLDNNYSGNPGRTRVGNRSATVGVPLLGYDGWPVLLRDASRLTPSAAPTPLTGAWRLTPAINEDIDIHYPDWPLPQTHQYSFGFQRELGKSMAIDIRYVGNTNMGGWTTWDMNDSDQWSMLAGENGFYDEFRKAQANLRANIVAGNGNTFAYTGAAGTSPLPIFMAYLQGIPLGDARNQVPANYTASQFRSSSWYNNLNMYSPGMTGIAGTGTSGLQNGIGTGTSFDANRIKAGLPINFFMANPAIALGNADLETGAGNTRYNGIQIDLRRRMSAGLLIAGNYAFQFGRQTWDQNSLREDWYYVPSTGGPIHSFKINWVYELPFGQGKRFGGGASRLTEMLIGGWEIDGIGRIQTGARFNYGGYRLVGMTEKAFADMFKFYHVTGADGKDRIYMFPQDVIEQSIIALTTSSATTATGYAGALPTGRYLAPASGPDCASYIVRKDDIRCPGTKETRILQGPRYWKLDMSFVKRIAVVKNMRIEARMDLFNIFNTINFNATSSTGSAVTNWQVTSAASDSSASQDPGGRITSFGLRFTW